jgi:L-iditol 2-dehydrogenase
MASGIMRVSVLRTAGVVEVEQRPVPQPGPGEVLVRVASVGVCGSDVHYFEHGRIGTHVVQSPLVLGHEAGGVVTGVGEGIESLQEGQRVSIEPGIPCRSCEQCVAGRYNLCPNVRFLATPPYDGAFAEFVVMPAAFVYAIPDTVSDDASGLLEPLSVGIGACRRARVDPESRVLITGAGPIGLIAGQVARAYGAPEVMVTDVNPHRLDLARELGMTAVDVSTTPVGETGFEADVLLECSGNGRATWDAVSTVARAGRVVLVGMGGDEVVLPLSYLQDRELMVTGAFRYANTWPTAIAMVASGRVDLDAMVTGHYGLDQVEEALTTAKRDPASVKVMVCPGG